MKKKTYIYLLVFTSCILGIIGPNATSYVSIFKLEYQIVKGFDGSWNSLQKGVDVGTIVSGFTLIFSHIFLVILFFFQKKNWFKLYILVIPLIFILSFVAGLFILIIFDPLTWILIAAFLFCWIKSIRSLSEMNFFYLQYKKMKN